MTTSSETEQAQRNVVDSLWDLFTSVKLALILILILAAASLIGALLPQVPEAYAGNPTYFNAWLAQSIRPQYGSLTDLFNALNFFNIYNAVWFHLIMGVLAFNVIICTIDRLPALWSSVFSPRVRMNEAFYTHSPNAIQVRGAGLSLDHLKRMLGRKLYQVRVTQGEGVSYFYGDRNGWAKLGTIATHLSLVLFLAGALVGSLYGFAVDGVSIAEGQTYQVNRNGFNFAVRNDKFVVEFYPDGRPKDYRSDLVVIENGKEVVSKTIRVNDPLVYKGVRFHQSSYGAYAMVQIKDASGNQLYNGQMDLYPQGSIYSGGVTLPGGLQEVDGQLTVGRQGMNFQIWDSQGAGPTAFVGQGQTGTVGNLQVTLQGTGQVTVLRMAYDPGATLIWIASGLMVLGLAITFYFPRRRIWGRVSEGEAAIAGTADRFVNLKEELRRMTDELKGEVPGLEIATAAEAPRAPRATLRRRKKV